MIFIKVAFVVIVIAASTFSKVDDIQKSFVSDYLTPEAIRIPTPVDVSEQFVRNLQAKVEEFEKLIYDWDKIPENCDRILGSTFFKFSLKLFVQHMKKFIVNSKVSVLGLVQIKLHRVYVIQYFENVIPIFEQLISTIDRNPAYFNEENLYKSENEGLRKFLYDKQQLVQKTLIKVNSDVAAFKSAMFEYMKESYGNILNFALLIAPEVKFEQTVKQITAPAGQKTGKTGGLGVGVLGIQI